ncbi:MAG: polysaccharide lyase family 8 super-sandwich domain-containing protein [Armatimonadota bacterium]
MSGALVTGNRHFWCSDFMVQQRPAYYLSVRVPGPRVLNADMACCGGEGRHCHYMADGATFIMRDGDEYRDLYPAWNWRQIPGTTVRQQAGSFDPETLRRFGERAFAGGASDGAVGCMAVEYARDGVAAKKAWFLFDEGMVALGAGITCAAEEPVRTTLNQCHWRGPAYLAGNEMPLSAGHYPLATGSAWWQDGVTYRILDGSGTLILGPQSGAWSDCGVGPSEPVTFDVMNAGLEHGVKPQGATYAYAVLPGVSAQDAFAANPERFLILRNDEAVQAVWHAVDQRGHAVLYTPGEVAFPDGQRIAADRPCILLYHPRNRVTLTVSQPERLDGLLTLFLAGPVTDTISISLPAGEYAGSSQTICWQR